MIAAITAGGRVEGELAAAIGTDVKALAPLGERRLVDAAIDAARASGARHVAVIGGDAIRDYCGARVDDVIPESTDGRENIRKAIEHGAHESLLLLASDMPFVSANALVDFLERSRGADIALPLATAEAYLAAYPGAPPHLTNVGGERVANGSVVAFGPGVAPRVLDSAQALFAARKSLARMAALLGPALLLRFAVRRLRIEHVERRAHQVFGVAARAIRDASPTLCFDVDSIEDYRYALAHLERA